MAASRINDEQLIEYAAGQCSGAEAAIIESHLVQHPKDASTVSLYQQTQRQLASDDSVEPSPNAIARARAIFQTSSAKVSSNWLTAVDRLVARLVFDSRVHRAALRYSGTGERINLSYETDSAEIDVQAERMIDPNAAYDVQTTPHRWQILGQVAESNPSPASAGDRQIRIALIVRGEGEPTVLAETTADEHGTFTLQALSGRYDLHIALTQSEGQAVSSGVVVISDIEIA